MLGHPINANEKVVLGIVGERIIIKILSIGGQAIMTILIIIVG
jgi:hypothetical protein